MCRSFNLLLFIFLLGCRKNDDRISFLLKQIKADNSILESFEYNNGLLVKEKNYSAFCATPVDEYMYVYENGRLNKLQTNLRSLYSSITSLCDPSAGIREEEQYEYDSQGRLVKTIRQNAYTMYEYNTQRQVIKQTIYSSNGTPGLVINFIYDARGNITSQTDSHGTEMHYQYDNKSNPFYEIKQRPGWVSAFNTSSNNVIKATGTFGGFERKILSYINGFPKIVWENNVTYTYYY